MKKALIWILTLSLLLSALPTWGVTLATETEKTVQIAPTLSGTEPALELVPEDTLVWAAGSPILRHIDAQVLESGTHVARLPEEESLNSYVFRNQDGSATAYILDEPVKFVDSSGVIQEKDLTLMSVTGGYTTARNDVALTLPNNPISGIGLQYKDSHILLIPQGGMSRATPQISDNSITYSNYFGNGISLRYTPTLSGVKEDIILAAYTGVNQFTFLLNTGGMGLFEADGRYYIAQSEQSEERITLSDIVTFDAHGRFHLGSTAVETLTDRQSYRLTITVDDAFLTDPNTTYPVMIDPTLTVNYDTYGANAIEDASIYSGYPNTNGDWVYLHAGYYDSNYKIARTLVRLPGLMRSSVYGDPDNFNITTVKFHIREATGSAPIAVRLYANTGSSTWVESSVTWNNAGVVLGSQYATASPKYGSDTIYDITSLVKAWQKGTLNAASGFVLRNSNETSLDKAFYSAEYSSTSYRPYVEVNYTYTSGSLNTTSCSINEGSTRTLSVSGLSGTVTWSSSNSSVASVNSSGVVTAIKAGTVTITATVPNYTPLKCTVYVTIPSGVYRIKNNEANLYIETSGTITEGTATQLFAKFTLDPWQLYQLWKITYLDSGYYSIRPLYKLDMALGLSNANVVLNNVGTTDNLSVMPSGNLWTITGASLGYALKRLGSNGLAMTPNGDTPTYGTAIMADVYSSTALADHWTLERESTPPAGVLLYNTVKQAHIPNPSKHMPIGTTKTLSDFDLCAIAYSADTNSQTFYWYSSNTAVATVNSSTGAVTGISPGTAVITGRVSRDGSYYYVKFGVCVGFPTLFNDLIDMGVIPYTQCDTSGDGLFLSTVPVSQILTAKGITTLPVDEIGSETKNVSAYDDWYIYAVDNGAEVSYGLFKMRGNSSSVIGVTISFIAINRPAFTNSLNSPTLDNTFNLFLNISKSVGPDEIYAHDNVLAQYFAQVQSKGPYLIAEKFVIMIANTANNGIISLSNTFKEHLNTLESINIALMNPLMDTMVRQGFEEQQRKYSRVPDALANINETAAYTIYDSTNLSLSITDPNNLTLLEKQAILSCYTGNVTFNSFAAEVQFHADAAFDWKSDYSNGWYLSAIRADMSIGKENAFGLFEEFYNLSSDIVQAQITVHGEY